MPEENNVTFLTQHVFWEVTEKKFGENVEQKKERERKTRGKKEEEKNGEEKEGERERMLEQFSFSCLKQRMGKKEKTYL